MIERVMMLRASLIASAIFVILQFVRPEVTNPSLKANFRVPEDVKRILTKSCYGCHSNETQLSWFDRIIPASQIVARDVKKARMALNFSDLDVQPGSRQRAVLFEAVNQIQMGAMPPQRYTLLHREAVVTPNEVAILRDYLSHTSPDTLHAKWEVEAADEQYRQWIAAASQKFTVQVAPNGIAFFPEYKNWTAISTTDRSDTNTLKVILGNEIATQAITDRRINPWPDGTVLVKVSWSKEIGRDGVSRPGSFEQVAFMIKNRKRFATTAGWGWAQWMGGELKPYGKTADFARQCVACHTPLRGNDYVFTAPILTNGGAG